jgi:hypothetical protein
VEALDIGDPQRGRHVVVQFIGWRQAPSAATESSVSQTTVRS